MMATIALPIEVVRLRSTSYDRHHLFVHVHIINSSLPLPLSTPNLQGER
jgi:hypothetical protein